MTARDELYNGTPLDWAESGGRQEGAKGREHQQIVTFLKSATPEPWYSVRGVEAPVGGEMGHIVCFLRDGDRVFLTYSTTGRGNEPVNGSLGLLDMTPYGRREAWEDHPEGWPEAPQAGSPVGGHGSPICWYWRSDADGVATWGPTSRPVPQWTRPGATPVETLGRQGHHH